MAPTADQSNTAAERRRLAIQESKFLGGDMEHTHLVKGLDFALLQKVRSEIAVNDNEETETETAEAGNEKEKEKDPAAEVDFVSVQGRKIYKAAIGSKPPQRNELFYPGMSNPAVLILPSFTLGLLIFYIQQRVVLTYLIILHIFYSVDFEEVLWSLP